MRRNEKHEATVTAGFAEAATASATFVSKAFRWNLPRAGGMKLKSHGCQSLWCSTRTHRGVRLAVSPNVRLRRFQIDACVRMTQIEYCNLIDATLCCASSSAALSKSLADMDGCPVRFSR